MMRPGRPKMSPIKSMRKITPQEISFEDNTQGGRRWLRARVAYRIKKLLTAKVAKESREGREESLGITLNSLGSRGMASFSLRSSRGFAEFAVKTFQAISGTLTIAGVR